MVSAALWVPVTVGPRPRVEHKGLHTPQNPVVDVDHIAAVVELRQSNKRVVAPRVLSRVRDRGNAALIECPQIDRADGFQLADRCRHPSVTVGDGRMWPLVSLPQTI
jgi:hypothetical protein